MNLIHFVRRELTLSTPLLIFIASISALSNTFILLIINTVSGSVSDEDSSTLLYFVLFLVSTVIYIFAQRYILVVVSKEVDQSLHKIRLRIIDKIEQSELLTLEKIGKSDIYSSISKEMQSISEATIPLVMMCQSIIFLFFALIYIAFQSLTALALYIVFVAVIMFVYFRRDRVVRMRMHEILSRENDMLDGLTHLLDGFKEVKLNDLRREDLHHYIEDISSSIVDLKGESKKLLAGMAIFTQSFLFFLIAAVVFALPLITTIETDEMAKLTASMMFLIAPVGALVGGVQMYFTANVAAENIEIVEAAINEQVRPMAQRRAEPLIIHEAPFSHIAFDQVVFNYLDGSGATSFQLGPIDLSIVPGQTIFIAGGNGSGKSTFLRVLTGLYFATNGELKLDGQLVSESNAAAYRNLFAVIFYDYHLFDRLYGLRDVDAQQVEALLQKLELTDKTRLVDDRFETLDLSTGQRRRLALLINYLENKPICVFDEWAAEQDPEYRRRFYTDILPELKAIGKTLIVVTHDDRYYNVDYVDRILRFEEGRLISDMPATPTSTPG